MSVTPKTSYIGRLIAQLYNTTQPTNPVEYIHLETSSALHFQAEEVDVFTVSVTELSDCTNIAIYTQNADPNSMLIVARSLDSKFYKQLKIVLY